MTDLQIPEPSDMSTPEPGPTPKAVETPKATKKKVAVPTATTKVPEIPKDVKPENCVKIGDTEVEIKPTKLRYFRNRTASIYNVLKLVPLSEFLAYTKGMFDDERDSDQILFDFLVAVFDDSKFVSRNYDDMTSEDIERILEIFGRVNHINEKEELARKNREAQATR